MNPSASSRFPNPEGINYPMLVSDYCLRCCKPFETFEVVANVIASGGGDRQVVLQVCADCIRKGDSAVAMSVYVKGGNATDPDSMRPRVAGATLDGFLHLKLLDNGFWRVGLKHGHAEIWTKHEVDSHLARRPAAATPMGYSHDYSLYGSMKLIGKVPGAHAMVAEEFLDLRATMPFDTLESAARS
jgi:hypothetical protein